MSKSYRSVDFVSNGWGGGSNYSIPGPLGTQFASPFGDPYRVASMNGFLGSIGSAIGSIGSGLGKLIMPALPILAPVTGVVVGGLLAPKPQAPAQQPSQSNFTVASQQAAAEQAAIAAEKSNTTVYLIAGGVALVALYLMTRRRK
jgi:hypothetical protein